MLFCRFYAKFTKLCNLCDHSSIYAKKYAVDGLNMHIICENSQKVCSMVFYKDLICKKICKFKLNANHMQIICKSYAVQDPIMIHDMPTRSKSLSKMLRIIPSDPIDSD